MRELVSKIGWVQVRVFPHGLKGYIEREPWTGAKRSLRDLGLRGDLTGF